MSKTVTVKEPARFALLTCKVLISLNEQSEEVQNEVRAQFEAAKKKDNNNQNKKNKD